MQQRPTDAAPDFERSAALADDIAELRSRFPETRAMYREVCGLLFFRYGITPTANKLYQLVGKGSMGTPAEVLQAFWQELRARTRVTIDHPDLPQALKDIAAGAVQTIWHAANEAATGELATLRAEARAAASAAEAERDAAHAETARARPPRRWSPSWTPRGKPSRRATRRWPPSARPTRRPRRGWRRVGRNWRPRAGSWTNCEPNSRPSWSAPTTRSSSPRNGPRPASAAPCANWTRSAPHARRASALPRNCAANWRRRATRPATRRWRRPKPAPGSRPRSRRSASRSPGSARPPTPPNAN
ncbi:protein of unknown function (plasmid) [Cupriavidus taiwanensis]|uniref:KfrA N-terminal DNA-binding domain-containing protein n=1 Tax=Cupriavidus taiwanensis TaxID=164546 RepID=A0A375ECN6_9BURK|nr:protein of unknown function [Cupriavidus taiwanensis]SOZ72289.1 protein of unknown function [Cupriavidus taiwanensis]SOZ74579.1 protein of unknown function [Cupriavidus taiwanensis]SPA03497.1 protein of unknown function [Cupriavidus taiwanensis]SPA12633.1 hypothetical protein CBM2625_U20007 [Cupriavidus taiwanensis]